MGGLCTSDGRCKEVEAVGTVDVVTQTGTLEELDPRGYAPLRVTIVSARSLRNADRCPGQGVSDPFVVCEIAGKPLSKFLTKVVNNNLNPVWNQQSEFADYEAGDSRRPGDALAFTVWDKDVLKQPDLLGTAYLQNSQFHNAGFDGELRLSQAGKTESYLKVKVEKPEPATEPVRTRPVGAPKRAKASGNANRPGDYRWLEGALRRLSANEVAGLGCRDAATGRGFAPAFFVVGGCPNTFCGAQAMMFCTDENSQLDFWWVKPKKDDPAALEPATLNLNAQGQHKNTPGLSHAFYLALATLFQQGSVVRGWRFGLERLAPPRGGPAALRAYLQPEPAAEGDAGRLYVHLFWQESWSANPFARSKYILGQIVYQKALGSSEYFSRQYEIHDGAALIADFEEPAGGAVLPGDGIKDLWDLRG